MPAGQRPAAEPIVLQAIKTFLQACPLDPPHVPDIQPHPDPQEKRGTIVLPLLKQNAVMNSSSLHWQAFNTFLDTLAIAWSGAALFLEVSMKDDFRKATEICRAKRLADGPYQGIAPRIASDCFESFRLSANLSYDLEFLTTSHPSRTVSIMTFGYFTGGDLDLPMLNQTLPMRPGTSTILCTAFKTGSTPFVGERYQVEFFLPDLTTSD
ncbi:uncharacterized protein LY89DRAFT_738324 [Mollisia scopiformis]|uniref:Uncharacterized protein n=1 Tax=Mollisia scopiformis TaxID=149040 RepID=A0A194WX43_MOLSC|nr:uncharacterized protein LY89DRAFT_738324 [Mollisia scopiformis]KUJ12548.1 hypothetical protein LY89DRAFT_738324 [Mollisia scopiformis]